MKTHYIGHDDMYKRLKKEGKKGWSSEDDIQETITFLERFLKANYVPKKGKLIELGCGAGDFSFWLVEKGYEVFGVDIAPTAILWAQEKAAEKKLKVDFQIGNVLDLRGYADNSFDFAYDSHCLHCIIGKDRRLFLDSVYRVLKVNGYFYVGTMCGEIRGEEEKKHFDPVSRCLVYKGIAARYIGLPDDILSEIQGAGFQIMDWEEVVYDASDTSKNSVVSGNLLVGAIKK